MSAVHNLITDQVPVTNSGIDFSAYDQSYRLLKEAQESWQYAVSDKLVYSLKPFEGAFDSFVGIAKDYLNMSGWIEAHLVFEEHGKRNHACVVVMLDEMAKFPREIGKMDV